MRIPIALTVLALLAIGCKNKETEVTTPEAAVPIAAPEKECYEFVSDQDTIRLSINLSNNVTGELQYLFHEKDKSRGTLSGAFIGDTLFADYNFQSEGKASVRETVFVRKGNWMIPGYGEVEVKDGREHFKSPHSLTFDDKSALRRTDCK